MRPAGVEVVSYRARGLPADHHLVQVREEAVFHRQARRRKVEADLPRLVDRRVPLAPRQRPVVLDAVHRQTTLRASSKAAGRGRSQLDPSLTRPGTPSGSGSIGVRANRRKQNITAGSGSGRKSRSARAGRQAPVLRVTDHPPAAPVVARESVVGVHLPQADGGQGVCGGTVGTLQSR